MEESIVTHLALRLGVDPHEAEEAYWTLTKRVLDHLHAGHSYHVPMLGTFKMIDATVTFTPNAALAEAVNHRFAGMETIVVGETAAPETTEEAVPSTPPAVAEAAPPAAEAPAEAASEETVEAPQEAAPEPPKSPVPPTPVPTPAPPEQSLKRTRRSPRRIQRTVPEKNGSKAGLWLLLVAALLFAAGAITFFTVFDGSMENVRAWAGNSPVESPPPSAAESPAPTDPVAAASTSAVPDSATGAATDTLGTATADTARTATEAIETDAPLPVASPQIDPLEGGWTLVVGAFETNADAEVLRDNIRARMGDEPYPVDIVPAAPGARFRYRICVGQFASSDEAHTTLRSLSGVLPSDAWVLRLE